MSQERTAVAPAGLMTRLFAAEDLTRRASLNSLAAGVDYGARLAMGFVVNPILVVGLGTYGYGAWQILQRVVGYVGPGAGRTTQVLKTTISNRQASLDVAEKRRLLGSALTVWTLFLPTLLVAGAVLGWMAPAWLKAPADLAWAVRVAAVVLVADAILTTLVEMPRSVVEGENLAYKRLGLSTILLIGASALVAVAVWAGTGLVGAAVATLIGTTATGVFFLQVARTYVPWFGADRPSRPEVKRFIGLSGWFLAWSFVMKLMRSSDVVVLGLAGSVEIVTTYTLTKYLPETLINFVSIFVFSTSPGLGRLIGAGEMERARQVRAEIMGMTWLVVTSVGGTILLWNGSFVRLWVGAEHDAGRVSTLLVLLLSAQFILIRNDANIIDLTLDLKHKVLLGLLSLALSLGAAVLLVATLDLGIPGLCAGFAAGRVVLSLAYPWLVGRHLGSSVAGQLAGSVRPVLASIALLGSAVWLGARLHAESWMGLGAGCALTLAMMLAGSWYGGLSTRLRRDLQRRVRKAIPA